MYYVCWLLASVLRVMWGCRCRHSPAPAAARFFMVHGSVTWAAKSPRGGVFLRWAQAAFFHYNTTSFTRFSMCRNFREHHTTTHNSQMMTMMMMLHHSHARLQQTPPNGGAMERVGGMACSLRGSARVKRVNVVAVVVVCWGFLWGDFGLDARAEATQNTRKTNARARTHEENTHNKKKKQAQQKIQIQKLSNIYERNEGWFNTTIGEELFLK